MANEAAIGLVAGDRAQGYEVRGPATLAGLDAAYAGIDARDRDADVTLIWLAESQDQSAVFDSARVNEQLKNSSLIGARTVVRFGAGLAAVIGKEHGGPLNGETLEHWLRRNAPISPARAAGLFTPILDALTAMHAQGHAHGMLSASHLIVGRDGHLRLLGSWLPNGAGPAAMVAATKAPEVNGGDRPNPASDLYSVSALLIWALTGTPAPSAEARTASRAQRDDDPFVPLTQSMPSLDPALANVIDTGMRLHPAVRPQGFAALKDALGADGLAAAPASPPESASTPWASPSSNIPPPLPAGTAKEGGNTPPPLPRRGAGVPTVSRQTRTSTIGARPPALPNTGQAGQPRKRKISAMTVATFVIALAVAWFIASDGNLFGTNDEPSVRDQTQTVEANRPSTTDELPTNEPRKGPSNTSQDDARNDPVESAREEIDSAVDGVLEQFCGSNFIFNQARDAGNNALRAYLDRCARIDGPFVDDARRELGL
ncbi:MAG: hypothetical protein Rhims3KO_29910 [Hyphomicrobiales bacterium]